MLQSTKGYNMLQSTIIGACTLGEVGLALHGLECLQRDESRSSSPTRRCGRQPPQIKGSSCIAPHSPQPLPICP